MSTKKGRSRFGLMLLFVPTLMVMIWVFSYFTYCSFAQGMLENRRQIMLIQAVLDGRLVDSRDLIRDGADPNGKSVVEGQDLTPLMAACQVGDLQIAEFLLKSGAIVDTPNRSGETPLIFSSAKGDLEMVKLLLKHGANIAIRDNTGRDAAIRAAERGNYQVLHVLPNTNNIGNALSTAMLIGAVWTNNPAILQEMMRKVANVNGRAYDGGTALMLAAANCRTRTVGELLQAGADANLSDPGRGDTPLHCATESGCIPVMEMLIQSGASLDAQNNLLGGLTPLMVAVNNGDLKAVKLLLQSGADPTIKTSNGTTAFGIAEGMPRHDRNDEMIKILRSTRARKP